MCLIGVSPFFLAACNSTQGEISRDSEPFNEITQDAIISVGGTEPFWALTVTPVDEGYQARYSAPELPDGVEFSVSRFAGNNGLGFSGTLDEEAVSVAITPGDCSDGMSDRTYPYTATVLLGDLTLYGCAHTDLDPFEEGETIP
ncbi:hypothetical protein [uncultured Erythrobacter sp.]|uniref:COG3650 family protein n=1 Tax=uncultured Erythrobacter sp. TaxID=263913 RepID=UPI00261B1D12|nr:hypothetical protein [uncultured Erythrobacter sp.]